MLAKTAKKNLAQVDAKRSGWVEIVSCDPYWHRLQKTWLALSGPGQQMQKRWVPQKGLMVAEDVIDDRGSCIPAFQKINQGPNQSGWGDYEMGEEVRFKVKSSIFRGCDSLGMLLHSI